MASLLSGTLSFRLFRGCGRRFQYFTALDREIRSSRDLDFDLGFGAAAKLVHGDLVESRQEGVVRLPDHRLNNQVDELRLRQRGEAVIAVLRHGGPDDFTRGDAAP